jgi:hypothetical protein
MGRYAGKITCNIHSFDWRPERRSWLDVVLSASKAAYAQSVMKLCGDKWKAAKAAGTTNGETWPQFLAQCRVPQSGGAAPAAPTYAPAPAAPLPTYGQAAGGAGKTTSQCDAEYTANKAAIRASGQTKRAFVASCRAGNETIPQGTAAAPPPSYQPPPTAPAPPPAPAPSTGSLFPWQQPAAPRQRPRLRTTAPLLLRPARASSRPINKHAPVARPIQSFGSTRSRTSTITRACTVTGPRRNARTCAKPTREPPATVRR